MSKKEYPTDRKYDELEAMARRTDDSLMNPVLQPIMQQDGLPAIQAPGADTVQAAPKRSSAYTTLFGDDAAAAQAYDARNTAFQDMLNARKQVARQARTDNTNMARYNALGNLLTTMVQPVGWAVGGRGVGPTGGVQPYDNRQYLEAFNRAVKASDDLRNIGTSESEYNFKIADEDYRRALALGDEARRRQQDVEDAERKYQANLDQLDRKLENDIAKMERNGEIRMAIEQFKASHRVTSKGGLSVDDRNLMAARKEWEKYKRTLMQQGRPYLSFDEYLTGEGYVVTNPDGAAPPAAGRTGSSSSRSGSSSRSSSSPTTDLELH